MISECVICEHTIGELNETEVRNLELQISYCQWKNVDERLKKVTVEETISDCLQNLR